MCIKLYLLIYHNYSYDILHINMTRFHLTNIHEINKHIPIKSFKIIKF